MEKYRIKITSCVKLIDGKVNQTIWYEPQVKTSFWSKWRFKGSNYYGGSSVSYSIKDEALAMIKQWKEESLNRRIKTKSYYEKVN